MSESDKEDALICLACAVLALLFYVISLFIH
jgi:hypothetical protein